MSTLRQLLPPCILYALLIFLLLSAIPERLTAGEREGPQAEEILIEVLGKMPDYIPPQSL